MCFEVPPSPTLALAALGEGHHVETSHRQGVGRNTRRSAGIGLSTWTPPTKATPAGTGWASTFARTPDPFEAPISRSYHGPGQPMQGLRPPRVGSTVQARRFEPGTSAIRSSRQGRHARVNIGGVPTHFHRSRHGAMGGSMGEHICSDTAPFSNRGVGGVPDHQLRRDDGTFSRLPEDRSSSTRRGIPRPTGPGPPCDRMNSTHRSREHTRLTGRRRPWSCPDRSAPAGVRWPR